jgi:hypothetical protein
LRIAVRRAARGQAENERNGAYFYCILNHHPKFLCWDKTARALFPKVLRASTKTLIFCGLSQAHDSVFYGSFFIKRHAQLTDIPVQKLANRQLLHCISHDSCRCKFYFLAINVSPRLAGPIHGASSRTAPRD